MFTIYGGKTEFNQWEQGQMVTNPNMAVGDMVRFWNGSGETHPMIAYTHEGVVVVDVPNDLLQRAAPILVDLCKDPERMTRFTVNFVSCKAPEDYQFVDNTHCEPVVPPGGGSGGGGGVTSWNDLEDKPFGVINSDALFTISLDADTTVHDQYDSLAEQGFTVRQTNMAEWEFSKNIGEVYLEGWIGATAVVTHFQDGSVEEFTVTEDNLSADTLSIRHRMASVSLSANGDLVVCLQGGASTYEPDYAFTSIKWEQIKTIDPKYLPNIGALPKNRWYFYEDPDGGFGVVDGNDEEKNFDDILSWVKAVESPILMHDRYGVDMTPLDWWDKSVSFFGMGLSGLGLITAAVTLNSDGSYQAEVRKIPTEPLNSGDS